MSKFADDDKDAVGETVVDNESAPTFDLSSLCLPIFQKLSGDGPENQPTGIDKRATQEQVEALYGLKKSSTLDPNDSGAPAPESGSWIQVSDAFQRLIGTEGGDDDDDERADMYLDQEPPHPLDGVSATYDQAIDIEFHRQQQLVQVMESEKTFLREFVGMLKGGFRLIKHSRSGAASMRILKISTDGREISWELKRSAGTVSPEQSPFKGAQSPPVGENVTFMLNEIRTVRRAIPVASVPKVHAERCFTLVVNSRAVVFEAIDAATRELIVDGFSLMLRYLQQLKAEQKSSSSWMNVA